jgi:hypothetical protein
MERVYVTSLSLQEKEQERLSTTIPISGHQTTAATTVFPEAGPALASIGNHRKPSFFNKIANLRPNITYDGRVVQK